MKRIFVVSLLMLLCFVCNAQIKHIWITHSKTNSDSVVISWYTKEKGNSVVEYWSTLTNLKTVSDDTPTNLHHIEIPLAEKDSTYYYILKTGSYKTPMYAFKGYPSKRNPLRIAFVGNLGYTDFKKYNPLENICEYSDPHLIVSCGDNIPSLHLGRNNSAPVPLDDITAFLELIEKAPEVFRSTIFMPILGNHDKEFRGRFKKRPNLPQCVYDVDATAYCKFFELPEKEWHWFLDIPQVNLRLVALDLCHLRDVGTGHQACHMFHSESEQFKWYKKIMEESKNKYLISLYNSSNNNTRNVFSGIWRPLFEKGSACIAGFGYFMEYAKMKDNAFTYINTSLASGDPWFDRANSLYSKQISGYVLLTFSAEENSPTIDIRATEENKLLYRTELKAR